jgi:hypothetical protein
VEALVEPFARVWPLTRTCTPSWRDDELTTCPREWKAVLEVVATVWVLPLRLVTVKPVEVIALTVPDMDGGTTVTLAAVGVAAPFTSRR